MKAALAKAESFTTLCRRFGITRPTGYVWLARYAAGGTGTLEDRACGRVRGRISWRRQTWQPALLALRRSHPSWGPKKLLAALQRQHRRARLPSERTIARLLRASGQVGRRKQRCRPGPQVAGPARVQARRANTVWTVDFKGHFRTGDGRLCRPLTVRDLFSRYLLVCEHVASPSEAAVRRVMQRCFRRFGLPRVIRVDNGAPFAGVGALRLSALSAWWCRLGIELDFTRRGKPQDNGAHEQMHRVLKAEIANPPAPTLRQQQARLQAFCHHYNQERPHEALAQKMPAQKYRLSRRRYAPPAPLHYPAHWLSRRTSSGGYIKWAGRARLVGRAFAHEQLGLKPKRGGEMMWVFLGKLLIGELHRQDLAGMRPAQRRPRHFH